MIGFVAIAIAMVSGLVMEFGFVLPEVGLSEYAKYSDTGAALVAFQMYPLWSVANILLFIVGMVLIFNGFGSGNRPFRRRRNRFAVKQ